MGLKGHLVMLHGMTGTSAKMMPLAKEITPSGWGCLCPEGPFIHPSGGRAWWLNEQGSKTSDPEIESQISISMDRLEGLFPPGKLILGGFSQGGAIASAMCDRDTFDRVVGLVLIATKTVRNKELKRKLNITRPRSVVWMHGERDHIIPIEAALEHLTCFQDAGWTVDEFRHKKGHMVDLSQKAAMIQSLERVARSV